MEVLVTTWGKGPRQICILCSGVWVGVLGESQTRYRGGGEAAPDEEIVCFPVWKVLV